MAAILRSGKFLRIVTGLARTGPAQAPQNGSKESFTTPAFPSLDPSGSHMPYHSFSLQHLQNALPLLSADPEKKYEEYVEISKLERRGSDPLLEFFVDKQKIEDVSRNFKAIKYDEKNQRVGLNVVQELQEEPRVEEKPKVEAKITNKASVEVQTQIVQTEEQLAEDEEALSEQASTAVPVVCETSSAHPLPMVPLIEDPSFQQQLYPLPVVCQMFRAQGRIYDLECLLWGSQGIRPEDRKCIYFWTLQAYADCGMFPQAVDLTRRLEAEGLCTEFPEYHSLMNNFAMAMYHIQSTQVPPSSCDLSSMAEQSLPPTPASEAEEQLALQAHYHRKLKKALANGDSKNVILNFRGLERTGGKELNITESSTLIELLVKEDLIEEAVEVAEKMLSREAYPMPRIFRFLLNRLASRGDVDAMTKLGSFLTSKVKKEVSFDNRLCNAYLAAGRAKDYLTMLITELEKVDTSCIEEIEPDRLQMLKDKFPRGGAMGLLESNPDLVEPYTRMALKFVQLGYIAPVNVLWTYHFINGRHDLAEPLWNKYVRTCPQIMFQKVCQTARSTGNVDLAERLVLLLENAVVTNGARGIAYSCLLDVLTYAKDFRRGISALEEGLRSGVRVEDINRTALKRLKEGLEAMGMEFPYAIPKKTGSSASAQQLRDIENLYEDESSSRSLALVN